MILKLKRAVAHHIEQAIPGLRCFAEEAANTERQYPCVYISEIDGKRGPLGCGPTDYTKRSLLDKVFKRGKLHEYKTVLRLLIAAAGSTYESPAEQAHRLTYEVDRFFLWVICDREMVTFVDPVSNEDLKVVGIQFISTMDVPPEIESEPLLFHRALTYRIVHRIEREEDVAHTMDNLTITQGGVNV